MIRKNFVTIDLDAIRHNYLLQKKAVGENVSVMPVIKADAYGHGMVQVARLLADKASAFVVAIPEEGVALREEGLTQQILVLGPVTFSAIASCVDYGLSMTVFEPDVLQALQAYASSCGKTAFVHIKFDTGMNRIGLRYEWEAKELAAELTSCPNVSVRGIYTHFSVADNLSDENNRFTEEQLTRYNTLRQFFPDEIPSHVCNSAMAIRHSKAYFNAVRQGISLYGYPPVQTELPFKPALTWQTEVTYVKPIHSGDSVGYGRTYIAERDRVVATVAVGYGDGYHRASSNKGCVLIRGMRAPIIGNICMDQIMVDVTDIPGVCRGDEVILIGSQGKECITAEDVASWAGTISYEILLGITSRVPRIWKKK